MRVKYQPTFIDIFSGCGGISLGLMSAGWKGLFAVEKNRDAFSTIYHNLNGHMGEQYRFSWPQWLPKDHMSVSDIVSDYAEELTSLRGTVDLLTGGPPCQGFSTAGRRNPNDPRNKLAEEYIRVVELVQPKFLLIENVHGFDMPFSDSKTKNSSKEKTGNFEDEAYSQIVKKRLEALGYKVFHRMITCADFGVPQLRKRFIMLSIKDDSPVLLQLNGRDPLQMLEESAPEFRHKKGLPKTGYIAVSDAISDLELHQRGLIACTDSDVKGFHQIEYKEPPKLTKYQKLMRAGMSYRAPNSLRLPRHKESTIEKFERIQSNCVLGKCLTRDNRADLGICKHSITPLHPKLPSVTVTTLPDDILHYSEPRILTVRENARLQSFPDWFEFQGKYTTGGKERKNQCPRYTQVGNAVPPLLSEAIGLLLFRLAQSIVVQFSGQYGEGNMGKHYAPPLQNATQTCAIQA